MVTKFRHNMNRVEQTSDDPEMLNHPVLRSVGHHLDDPSVRPRIDDWFIVTRVHLDTTADMRAVLWCLEVTTSMRCRIDEASRYIDSKKAWHAMTRVFPMSGHREYREDGSRVRDGYLQMVNKPQRRQGVRQVIPVLLGHRCMSQDVDERGIGFTTNSVADLMKHTKDESGRSDAAFTGIAMPFAPELMVRREIAERLVAQRPKDLVLTTEIVEPVALRIKDGATD